MESKASKEDKDKITETKMEESLVNIQNYEESACDKKEVDVTRSDSSQTQMKHDVPNVKQPKISEAMIKELEEQNFIKLVSKLKDPEKYGRSQFYCGVCCISFERVQEVNNHISGKGHKKYKKSKGPMLSMKRIPQPKPKQIEALDRMLELVVKQQSLDPVKDLHARMQVKVEIQEIVESHITGSYLTLYGSSITCFGFKTSDVNLDLTLPKEISVPEGLLTLLEVIQRNDKCIDVKDEFDLSTPQISFIHKKSGLTCHLSCGSKLVCKTSELLKCYAEINPVVRKLVVGFRFWAQSCSIDMKSDGGLTPYCFALMVIQFLQCINPPILPRLNVQEVKEISKDKLTFNTSNTASLGLLWFKLFRFYCVEFEIDENVISIRMKQPFSREARRWGHRRFAIEDPYMTGHNVSTVSSDKVFDYIICCMNTSFEYFGTTPNGAGKETSNTSINNLTSQETRSREANNEVKDEIHYTSAAKTTSLITKPPKPYDDNIFDMDDLEDGEGVAVGNEGGTAKTQGRDKEITALENKMGNLNVMNISQNSPAKKKEHYSKTPATLIDDKLPNTQDTNQALKIIESQTQIVYAFQRNVLSGGKKPEVQCQVCKKDGHSSRHCPDLRKPTLVPLPPLNTRLSDIVTDVCSKAREVIGFLPEERKSRENVLWNLEEYIQEVFPDAQLHLFGSSMNGFGFKDSDLDICMTLDGKCKEDLDCINIINQLAKKLKLHRDCSSVVAITTAKVPIVKFYIRSIKREADISLYNVLALENTKMLATYARLDDRVSVLGYTLKLFAKVCDIGDASKGSLSSYAYILMLLHFLQKRDPPVIPVLQELYEGDTQPRNMIDGWNCWFYDDIQNLSKVWKSKMPNKESVGSLWIGFLRYFTETFDWEHEVLCCRRIKRLTKFERMWTRHVFAIEDPFNLDHNLGAGISRKMGTFIRSALVRGRERFGSPPLHGLPYHVLIEYYFHVDYLTNGFDAPNDRTCRVCGHIGHIARECPRHKKNKKEEYRSEDRSKLSNRPFNIMNMSPRKRAATAPILITRKESVNEKSEKNLAESLPNDPLPRDAMRALNPPAVVTKSIDKSSGYDQSFAELRLKQETKAKDKPVTVQSGNPGSMTSQEQSHPQVHQVPLSRNSPVVVSQVGAQYIPASTFPLPSSAHTDTSNAPINSQASSNFNQDASRPAFGPVGRIPFASPSIPGNNVPYGVPLLPPEKFMSPLKGSGHPGGSPLKPFFFSQQLPGQVPGQVPDEARMLPQRQPILIPPGYPVRPPSENTMNAWPPSPQFEALYHSPHARNIPGQPRERPRSVSESMASPGALSEHRIPPLLDSSPPGTIPFGSPPQVFRSYQDNPFWNVGNLQGFSFQNVASPTRHPSSLPSKLTMPHPNRNVEQAYLLSQQQQQQAPQTSPPRLPHSVMSQAFGGNMSPEVFFSMVKEAEKQHTVRPPQDNQEIRPKPIPSSDAVLSHPVATPIFKPPKTADEKELFSKLNKVRVFWTSNAPEPQAQRGNGYIPSQEGENNFKEQAKENSHADSQKARVEEPYPQISLPRGIDMEVSTRTEPNQTSSPNVKINPPRSQNPNHGKPDIPSKLNEDIKGEPSSKGTESPVLKQQHDDDVKRGINSKDKTKQKQQQSSNDTSKASRKKQGLLGDKPGVSSAAGMERQEKTSNKNGDATDSSSPNSLATASKSENILFDFGSYQKAFPTRIVDIGTDSDRGNGSVPQQKPNKKQNRNIKKGQKGQESRTMTSSSQPSEESSSTLLRKGEKKGGYSEEGVPPHGRGPARKRRKLKEGLLTETHSSKEVTVTSKEEVRQGKLVEYGGAVEATQKKADLEASSKNSRTSRDNKNRGKQSKETGSEDKPGSVWEVPVEGEVALTPQGKKAPLPKVSKEDKTKGRRKDTVTPQKNRPPLENTTGTSSPVKTTPKRGEKSANLSKTTRVSKEDHVGGQEKERGATPVGKKESPTSRSEDSGEERRGGNGGSKRKSKGRGRGRGRGRGQDTQPHPGPGTDGKTLSPEKHKGSQEARK